jgi:hypothetical protein
MEIGGNGKWGLLTVDNNLVLYSPKKSFSFFSKLKSRLARELNIFAEGLFNTQIQR